jgi:hypothetical protein
MSTRDHPRWVSSEVPYSDTDRPKKAGQGGRDRALSTTASVTRARDDAAPQVTAGKRDPQRGELVKKTTPVKKATPEKKATPAKKITPAKKATPAKKITPANMGTPSKTNTPVTKAAANKARPVAGRSGALTARDSTAPVSLLDAADRARACAVLSEEGLQRQIVWENHHEVDLERKRLLIVFGYLAIGLFGVAALVALYLGGLIVLVHQLPGLSARQAATIVGSALVLATGGAAGGAAIGRFTGRRSGAAPAPAVPRAPGRWPGHS